MRRSSSLAHKLSGKKSGIIVLTPISWTMTEAQSDRVALPSH